MLPSAGTMTQMWGLGKGRGIKGREWAGDGGVQLGC